jgi:uncharacterized protein
MKAVLALAIIYVGTFLVVIQGASQNSGTPKQGAALQASGSIDPAKEGDIRSLMELLGVRDLVQDSTAKGVEQFRENLSASVPDNERGQQFVNAFVDNYQRKFSADEVTSQLVTIYDRHFTEEDIRGLLQFYGSPLGQKYATEMPKISSEIQAADRAATIRVAKEVLQDLRKDYPGIAGRARLQKQRPGQAEQAQQQSSTQPQTTPVASHP